VVHLALASITNACFDFWAKSRGKPLWKLLLDLTPSEVVRLLDLSYVEEVLSEQDVLEMLQAQQATREQRYSNSAEWLSWLRHVSRMDGI